MIDKQALGDCCRMFQREHTFRWIASRVILCFEMSLSRRRRLSADRLTKRKFFGR